MPTMLQVRFECHSLPGSGALQAGCRRLGIQEGKEVVQDAALEGKQEIEFQFSVQAEVEPGSGAVIWKGKFVQGPKSDPFVYLCWGDRAEGAWAGCGRSKIPLNAVPREQIERVLEDGRALRARIGLTGRRGSPAFATLKGEYVEWVE